MVEPKGIQTIEEVNTRDVKKEWIVGSTDVESLYPSLDVERCVDVVKRKLLESSLVFEHLQWKEIALYLRYNMTDEELQDSGFMQYIPARKHNCRPPLFVLSGSHKKGFDTNHGYTQEKYQIAKWSGECFVKQWE